MSLEFGRSSTDRDDADEPGDATAAKPGTHSYQRLWHAAAADAAEPDDDRPGDPVPDEAAGTVKTGMIQPGSPRRQEATAPPKTAALRPERVRLRQATSPAAPAAERADEAEEEEQPTADTANPTGPATDEAAQEPPVADASRPGRAAADAAADAAAERAPGTAGGPDRPDRPDRLGGPVRFGLGLSDGPLISDAAALRANWREVQAAFVDDPREAVSDAANLIEHAAQALAGALQHRQRQLRGHWDDAGTSSDGTGADGASSDGTGADGTGLGTTGPDNTERLRLVMQEYRALFNQICRP